MASCFLTLFLNLRDAAYKLASAHSEVSKTGFEISEALGKMTAEELSILLISQTDQANDRNDWVWLRAFANLLKEHSSEKAESLSELLREAMSDQDSVQADVLRDFFLA